MSLVKNGRYRSEIAKNQTWQLPNHFQITNSNALNSNHPLLVTADFRDFQCS